MKRKEGGRERGNDVKQIEKSREKNGENKWEKAGRVWERMKEKGSSRLEHELKECSKE